MFNSATKRSGRAIVSSSNGRNVKQKPKQGDVQWIIGFVVIGAILGALTSGVELPLTGNAPTTQTASAE